VTIKNNIEVIQVKHVARNDVWRNRFKGEVPLPISKIDSAAGLGKSFELVAVKLAIPEKKIFVGTELRAITQCCGAIFRLLARTIIVLLILRRGCTASRQIPRSLARFREIGPRHPID